MNSDLPLFRDLDRPPSNWRQTSRDAALSIIGVRNAQCRLCFEHISKTGDDGSTTDEAEVVLGMSHQTTSARFYDLAVRFGVIVDSGRRRITRSGREAIVWVVASPAYIERARALREERGPVVRKKRVAGLAISPAEAWWLAGMLGYDPPRALHMLTLDEQKALKNRLMAFIGL